jgi:hypothetical protein
MPDAGGMQALGRADGGWGAMLSATHEALRLLVGQTLLDAAPAIQRPVVARSRFR